MLHIKNLLNLLCNCFVAALETIGGLSIEFKIDPNKSIASENYFYNKTKYTDY